MTTIVTSSFAAGLPQADGRRYVREMHVDRVGREHVIEYGPVADIDMEATLAAHAAVGTT